MYLISGHYNPSSEAENYFFFCLFFLFCCHENTQNHLRLIYDKYEPDF